MNISEYFGTVLIQKFPRIASSKSIPCGLSLQSVYIVGCLVLFIRIIKSKVIEICNVIIHSVNYLINFVITTSENITSRTYSDLL